MENGPTNLSRRAFIASAACGVGAFVLGSCVPTSSVSASAETRLLAWLPEVERITKTIKLPVIPRERRELVALSTESDDSREAIQAALDKVAQVGGGTVVIPKGAWLVEGPLRLSSYTELHLSEGATLTFSSDPEDYLPPVFTRWEGTEAMSLSPFIYARGASHVAITGRGTIVGNGVEARKEGMVTKAVPQERLRTMGERGTPLSERVFDGDHALPPSLMQFIECNVVLIEGISVRDNPFWGIHPIYSHDVTIRDITVDSVLSNNDGIDIDSSRHVVIERCVFTTGDDCVAIKSGRDYDGRSVGRPSEDIVISDCYMKSGRSSAVAIGSEMSGGVRNVYVLNCKMDDVSTALCLKSNLDRGGFVEHVRMGRVAIERCDTVVGVSTTYHSYRGGRHIPVMRDIVVESVRCEEAKKGISLRGQSESPIRDLHARLMHIERVTTPFESEGAENLSFERVVMNGKSVTPTDGVPPPQRSRLKGILG